MSKLSSASSGPHVPDARRPTQPATREENGPFSSAHVARPLPLCSEVSGSFHNRAIDLSAETHIRFQTGINKEVWGREAIPKCRQPGQQGCAIFLVSNKRSLPADARRLASQGAESSKPTAWLEEDNFCGIKSHRRDSTACFNSGPVN